MLHAPAGSGKSWLLTRDLIEDWIPDHKGVFYSNLPFRLEPWEDDETGESGDQKQAEK